MNTLKIYNPQKLHLPTTLLALGLLAASTPASAVLMFDDSITAIFGAGNADTNWTSDLSGGIELGLRAKQRYPAANVFNSGGDGTYTHALGTPPADRVSWNFEWSIDVTAAGAMLDGRTYRIDIDFDPGIGTNFLSFDLINGLPFADHSIGTSATLNGAGVEATDAAGYAALIASNSKAQNSWNLGFFDDAAHPLALSDGQFTFVLSAFDGATLVASTSIEVIAGAGAQVPEPETLALLALGLAGIGLRRRQRTTT